MAAGSSRLKPLPLDMALAGSSAPHLGAALAAKRASQGQSEG